jgi:hypothetical protein
MRRSIHVLNESRLKMVLLAGLAVSCCVAVGVARTSSEPMSWMFWLIWPAMTLHQCEENVFTEMLLGKQHGFLNWVRSVGYDITPPRAFRLNIFMGWTLAILSGLAGSHFVYFPLFVAAAETVNGFWHLSVTALQQRWSPGTASGVLIVIPLGFWLFHTCLVRNFISPWSAVGLFLAACLSHHAFLGSLPRLSRS